MYGRAFPRLAIQEDVTPGKLLAFLALRPDAQGLPVLQKLGAPVGHADELHRMQILAMSEEETHQLVREGWTRAWHGCKLEALYSILCNGRLRESSGAGGVYVMKAARGTADAKQHGQHIRVSKRNRGCEKQLTHKSKSKSKRKRKKRTASISVRSGGHGS